MRPCKTFTDTVSVVWLCLYLLSSLAFSQQVSGGSHVLLYAALQDLKVCNVLVHQALHTVQPGDHDIHLPLRIRTKKTKFKRELIFQDRFSKTERQVSPSNSSCYLQGCWEVSLHVGDALQHALCHFALIFGLTAQTDRLVLHALHLDRSLVIPECTWTGQQDVMGQCPDVPPNRSCVSNNVWTILKTDSTHVVFRSPISPLTLFSLFMRLRTRARLFSESLRALLAACSTVSALV